MVVEAADGGELGVTFAVRDDTAAHRGRSARWRRRQSEVALDDLTAQILTAVVDDYELRRAATASSGFALRRVGCRTDG